MLKLIKSWIVYWRYIYNCFRCVWYRDASAKNLDKRRYIIAWDQVDICTKAAMKAEMLSEQYELLRGRPI